VVRPVAAAWSCLSLLLALPAACSSTGLQSSGGAPDASSLGDDAGATGAAATADADAGACPDGNLVCAQPLSAAPDGPATWADVMAVCNSGPDGPFVQYCKGYNSLDYVFTDSSFIQFYDATTGLLAAVVFYDANRDSFYCEYGPHCFAVPHCSTESPCRAPVDAGAADAPAEACATGLTACPSGCANPQTDPSNCGACGQSCEPGYCKLGVCHDAVVLASDQGVPWGIALDSKNVYWANSTDGRVVSVPKDGGSLTTLALGQAAPTYLAVDSTSAYFISSAYGSADGGAVLSVPLTGADPWNTTTLAAGQNNPSGLAVDGTSIYWTNAGDGTVMSVPLAGGTPRTLASGQSGASGIAVDATRVYWMTTSSGGAVVELPLAGGSPTTLVSGQGQLGCIALDPTTVYWTNGFGNGVSSAPLGGGGPTSLASNVDYPVGIAVDATTVFWTGGLGLDGYVMSAPKGGGSSTLLVSANHPFRLAVDSTSVYWTDQSTVMKLDKP
jgi:hypothetical protein